MDWISFNNQFQFEWFVSSQKAEIGDHSNIYIHVHWFEESRALTLYIDKSSFWLSLQHDKLVYRV